MTCLILIRHGPTKWNEEKRLQGRNDIPLSHCGRENIKTWRMVAEAANAIWYSSPLIRAVETANLLGIESPQIEPLLTEMSWGDWEGRKVDDIRAEGGLEDLNGGKGLDFNPPGGESRREVLARIQPFFLMVGQSNETVVAVTHKGIIEAAMSAATGWDMRTKRPAKVGQGASHLFDVDPHGALSVIRLNDPGGHPSEAIS